MAPEGSWKLLRARKRLWEERGRKGQTGRGSVGKIKVSREAPRSPQQINDLQPGKAQCYRQTSVRPRTFNGFAPGTTPLLYGMAVLLHGCCSSSCRTSHGALEGRRPRLSQGSTGGVFVKKTSHILWCRPP
jgi:hypothetical protein